MGLKGDDPQRALRAVGLTHGEETRLALPATPEEDIHWPTSTRSAVSYWQHFGSTEKDLGAT